MSFAFFLFSIMLFTFGQVKDNAHPPTNQTTKQSPDDGKVHVALIEDSTRDEGAYNRFVVFDTLRDTEVTAVLRFYEQTEKRKSGS